MEIKEYGTKLPRLKRFPIYRDPTYRGCTVYLTRFNKTLEFGITANNNTNNNFDLCKRPMFKQPRGDLQ